MKTINGQTLYNIALQSYGSVDAVFALFSANSDLFVDGFTTVLSAGSELTLPNWQPEKKTIIQSQSISINLTQSIPQIGMSLYDIAIAHYGSVNEVFELAKANNKSISDIFSHLDTIKVPEIKVSKPRARKYIQDKEIQPNSRIYPKTLLIEVISIEVINSIIHLTVSVLNQFPYSISTMLKFDFDQLAVDESDAGQFTDAFDFGVDLPMPDAQFTYDTREISNLGAFQKTTLHIQRAINETRTIIVSGVEIENQNQSNSNNIFYSKSIEIKY